MEALAEFEVQKITQSSVHEVDLGNPGFGEIFSDHMMEMKYEGGSWQNPVIKPYGPVEITPSLSTLHYGQSVFEGTKAYYVDEKTVHLFRPEKNAERLVKSCERMCIPAVDKKLFLDGIKSLIRLDKDWVPTKEGNSLYIRPFVCGWDNVVSAQAADNYRFYIITSPVGSYYTDPVKLITPQHYIRAAKGGTGEAKAAGNYASSFYPARKALEMGYDQILWLDAKEHKYVEEVGTMNIFFIIDDVLVTSPLTGTILPGVTRDSVIKLAQSWGMDVDERKLSIDELMEAGREERLQEVFGAGTAAVITPVESITHRDETISMPQKKRGPIAQKFYDTIYGIQTGTMDDPFNWVQKVEVDG
jgi:branched-chain amino acid aminotransferase